MDFMYNNAWLSYFKRNKKTSLVCGNYEVELGKYNSWGYEHEVINIKHIPSENVVMSNNELLYTSVMNDEFAFALQVGSSGDGELFLDFLFNWYHYNPVFKNGRIKDGFISAVREQSVGALVINMWITRLINENKVTEEYFQHSYNLPVLKKIKNLETNQWFYFLQATNSFLDGQAFMIPRRFDLSKMGYRNIDTKWWSNNARGIHEGVEFPLTYINEMFVACSECGTTHRRNALFNGVCGNCLGYDPSNAVIRNYSDRATTYFQFKVGKYRKVFKNPPMLGIELEYESSDRDVAVIKTAMLLSKHAIFKRDGSVHTGFEIVTAPATLDIHREEMQKFFAKFPDELEPKNSCGMHVHISRNAFNKLAEGKLIEFMNREDNKEFIKKIAGRWSDQYANNDVSRTITYAWNNGSTGGARYNALNLNNRDTLEFRIFASTKDWDEFIMRLEFCEAVSAYCMPCQSKAPTLKEVTSHKHFIPWVHENRKEYPSLFNFVKGIA